MALSKILFSKIMYIIINYYYYCSVLKLGVSAITSAVMLWVWLAYCGGCVWHVFIHMPQVPQVCMAVPPWLGLLTYSSCTTPFFELNLQNTCQVSCVHHTGNATALTKTAEWLGRTNKQTNAARILAATYMVVQTTRHVSTTTHTQTDRQTCWKQYCYSSW